MKKWIIVQIFFILNFVFCTGVFAKTVSISKKTMDYCFTYFFKDDSKFFDCCNSRVNEISSSAKEKIMGEETQDSDEKKLDTSKNIVIEKLKPKIVGGRSDPSMQQAQKPTEPKLTKGELLVKNDKAQEKREEEQKLVEDGKNKLFEILEKVRNDNLNDSNKAKSFTQDLYHSDVLDYRTVDLSKMSEQQACQYWKGEWKNNTCEQHTHKGRFYLVWQHEKKKFACYNDVEAYNLKLNPELATEENVALTKSDMKQWPCKYDNAQWDPVIEDCGSQSERDCRDSDNVWTWTASSCVCYLRKNNRTACENVGAVFKENNDGTQSCDCVASDREFHWKSTDYHCTYKMKSSSTSNSSTYLEGTLGGVMPNTQKGAIESCMDDLKEKGFFQGKSRLNCQKSGNTQTNTQEQVCKKLCNGKDKCGLSGNVCGSTDDYHYISEATYTWNENTKNFECKLNDYSSYTNELKQYNWHWNPDISTCSYTYGDLEYLHQIKHKSMFYSYMVKYAQEYPWQHNEYYDHSKDKSYCESIHSSCKYGFEKPGIPKCTCETKDKSFRWVYGKRICEYCVVKNGKQDCHNQFSSELVPHWLEGCLDVLSDKDIIVNFK